MRLLRIKAITKKELIHIWRDPLSLAIAFLMPVMQLFIYGYAITFDVNNITTVVYDQDKSRWSRELIGEFGASEYFTLTAFLENDAEIDEYLDRGHAQVAILIPPDFSERLKTGKDVQVGIFLDGSDSQTATIAEGYITAIAQDFSQRVRGIRRTPLIEARTRVWYNPELKSRNFIIPGLIAVIMAVLVALLTSLTIAREWERGTMEQLISTPVKTPELIIGKLIPYFLIGFIDLLISIAMGVWLFDVPLHGSVWLLIGLSSIFLFGGVCQGILLSILAKDSQAIASQMAILSTFLPAFLLSGFVYAISNMPRVLQVLTYIVPARYFVTILKGIFMKGIGIPLLLGDSLLLVLFGIGIFLIANVRFHKRIE
ncbi:ABC transporter permease subunit [candidate division KSB3 bacterium]|uniref:ABC transporter permease subunit n=1 Tax=candidate division KSB3 bacterium TaxID=2044937 RepID=A0A9D5JWJ2_9BACT|nr:ABC transporter permease subunit [candidate division KSB3 bacterium]MBD3325430.1 ABC transporter permease subunit [candidate division KSB3 bacterium]